MSSATPAAVRRQIQSGETDPVYLLQGEDEVEKSALAHEFEELVDEGLRGFNVDRVFGGDIRSGDDLAGKVARVVTAARTLPVMAPRRVVLVFQADAMLVPKRESDAATRALDELEALIRDPERHTALVFVSGSIDRRSRMFKLLARHTTLVECGVVESQSDAERWVRNRIAAAGAQIEPAAARLLAERGGTDVKRLRSDVERLLLYALGQKTISLDDALQVAGTAALQDDWAMTNAIEAGDGAAALRQLALLVDSGAPAEKILGQLGWLVRTKFPVLAPDSLRTAVEAVFRTDVALKTSAGDQRILLERLVVELCARRRGVSALGRGEAGR
jgi:DNA polymerase-3 subunit delta